MDIIKSKMKLFSSSSRLSIVFVNFESIAIDDRFSLPGRGPFFGMVKSGIS